jgi:thiosulfate/3-mercaptopyruvate sulfurtransferase
VFYGYAPYLGFWLMKSLGHSHVRILDASRDAWMEGEGPWTAETSQVPTVTYTVPPAPPTSFASLESIGAAVGTPTN